MTDPAALIAAAREAARHAHAPYSRFAVGAALLLADGSIVTGCNFENASYGLSLCAETVALATANAQGKLADVVLLKNEDSPTWAPLINPYGQVVYQAQRGDVHTVLVGGEVVKSEGKLVAGDLKGVKAKLESTVSYLEKEVGDDWIKGQFPEIPEAEVLYNPYQYKK